MVSRAEGVAEKVRKVGVATEGDRQDLCGDGDTLVLVVTPCYFLPRWYHTETISNSHAGPLYYFFNCMRIYCYLTIQVFTYKQAKKKQISKPQRPVATLRGKNATAKHLIRAADVRRDGGGFHHGLSGSSCRSCAVKSSGV